MKNKSIYPWVVVGLLWIVALLNYMDRQMLSTMQEAMKVDIVELNKAEAFGALMAIFLWIYGFMSPVAGIIADRVNRKWLVVGSLFVWSAGSTHDRFICRAGYWWFWSYGCCGFLLAGYFSLVWYRGDCLFFGTHIIFERKSYS